MSDQNERSDPKPLREQETSLGQNEQLLRLAMRGAKAGSWDWDLTTGKLMWSSETYHLYGVDPNEFIPSYDNWYNNLLHPDDRPGVKAYIEKVLAQCLPEVWLQFRIIHPQKGTRWLLSLGCLTCDEQGEPIRLSGINLDISDRQEAEEALRRSEERYRYLVEISSQLIWNADEQGRTTYVSQQMCDYIGLSLAQLLNLGWQTVIHPDDLERIDRHWMESVQTGLPYEAEYRLRRADGVYCWHLVRAIPYRQEQGIQWFGISIDISERKELEFSLKASETKFSRILDSVSAAISSFRVYANRDWDYEYWSAGCEKIYGYSLAELADKHFWLSQVHPDDREQVLMPLFDYFFAEREVTVEYRFRHKDGSLRWFSSSYSSQKVAEPEAEYWIVTTVNYEITNLKYAELRLQEQVAREHLLAEISQTIHQTLDISEILQVTLNRIRLFLQSDRVIIFRFQRKGVGKVISEAVTKDCLAVLGSEIEDPCFEEQYQEPYRQGRISAIADFSTAEVQPCYQELMAKLQVKANLVVPILQKDHLWGLLIVHHCTAPRSWSTEEIELLQQIATQLGIAIQQAELYQKNAEQASLIDIATDAIFVQDLTNRILFWSQGAERLYGWSASEVVGKIAFDIFQRESLFQLEPSLQTTLKQGSWSGELKQITKQNKEIVVQSRWTLMPNGDRDFPSILVVNTDITEKKFLEKQLQHAQRLESIGTLASGIAHDLNNILTPLLAIAQLLPLKIPDLDEATLKLLDITRTNTQRAANIIKQLLWFSSATASDIKIFSLGLLLEELLKLIQETFPKTIKIESFIASDLWLIEGDSTQLHQVLMNLCVNARDAMPNGGSLVITANNLKIDQQYSSSDAQLKIGTYVVISVKDTGIGIPPENINKIFDPFFTTKPVGQGSGLGLSTALGIIKNHGGTIQVNSDRRQGNGTEFKIYLPAADSPNLSQNPPEVINLYGEQELILLVDDEPTILEITQVTLETYNYRVLTAQDGFDAIALYAQQSQDIQVVLMDLIMPDMDGLTAMRALKRINPDVKMIVASGLITSVQVQAAKALGIQGFLTKPYTEEQLLSLLKEVIVPE